MITIINIPSYYGSGEKELRTYWNKNKRRIQKNTESKEHKRNIEEERKGINKRTRLLLWKKDIKD